MGFLFFSENGAKFHLFRLSEVLEYGIIVEKKEDALLFYCFERPTPLVIIDHKTLHKRTSRSFQITSETSLSKVVTESLQNKKEITKF